MDEPTDQSTLNEISNEESPIDSGPNCEELKQEIIEVYKKSPLPLPSPVFFSLHVYFGLKSRDIFAFP